MTRRNLTQTLDVTAKSDKSSNSYMGFGRFVKSRSSSFHSRVPSWRRHSICYTYQPRSRGTSHTVSRAASRTSSRGSSRGSSRRQLPRTKMVSSSRSYQSRPTSPVGVILASRYRSGPSGKSLPLIRHPSATDTSSIASGPSKVRGGSSRVSGTSMKTKSKKRVRFPGLTGVWSDEAQFYKKHNITYLLQAYRTKYLMDTPSNTPHAKFSMKFGPSMEYLYQRYFDKINSMRQEVRTTMMNKLKLHIRPEKVASGLGMPQDRLYAKRDSTCSAIPESKMMKEGSRSKSYRSGLIVERRKSCVEELEMRQKRQRHATERFKRAFRIVRTVNRWVRAVILHAAMFHPPPPVSDRLGDEVTEDLKSVKSRKGSEAQSEESNHSLGTIAFDKSFFKVRREPEHHIPFQTRLTLSTPTSERSPQEIQQAVKSLQHMSTFAEYPHHMQEKLISVGWFEKVTPNRVIIRQTHTAENFYFILSGSVIVTKADRDPKTGEGIHKTATVLSKGASFGSPFHIPCDCTSAVVVTKLARDPKTGEGIHRTATILHKGASFGELALLYQSARTATVTSRETVHLLTVGRGAFFDVFSSVSGQHSEHIRFVKTMDFMKYWPINKLVEQPDMCLTHYFRRNQLMTQDGGNYHAQWIYIIKTGSCDVIKSMGDPELYGKTQKKGRVVPSLYFSLANGEPEAKVDCGLRNKGRRLDPITRNQRRLDFRDSSFMPPAKNESSLLLGSKFVVIEHLNPRDTFGLSNLFFEEEVKEHSTYEVSLVSRGAECVMINKAYYMRHADHEMKRQLRFIISRYPDPTTLPTMLLEEERWKEYKKSLVVDIATHRKKNKKMKQFRAMFGHRESATELPSHI